MSEWHFHVEKNHSLENILKLTMIYAVFQNDSVFLRF